MTVETEFYFCTELWSTSLMLLYRRETRQHGSGPLFQVTRSTRIEKMLHAKKWPFWPSSDFAALIAKMIQIRITQNDGTLSMNVGLRIALFLNSYSIYWSWIWIFQTWFIRFVEFGSLILPTATDRPGNAWSPWKIKEKYLNELHGTNGDKIF